MPYLLSLAGILGAALWIALAFFAPDWGPPGSDEYAGYELWNRLWSPALFGMACGFGGLFLNLRATLTRPAKFAFGALLFGFALMIIGNIGEFWLFTTVPYSEGRGPNTRDLAWITFLIGALIVLIATAAVSLTGSAQIPRLLRLLFLLPLPLTIAIFSTNPNWSGMPIGILALIVSSCVLTRAYADRTPIPNP